MGGCGILMASQGQVPEKVHAWGRAREPPCRGPGMATRRSNPRGMRSSCMAGM